MTHYCFGDVLFSMSEPGSECFFFFSVTWHFSMSMQIDLPHFLENFTEV